MIRLLFRLLRYRYALVSAEDTNRVLTSGCYAFGGAWHSGVFHNKNKAEAYQEWYESQRPPIPVKVIRLSKRHPAYIQNKETNL